MVKTLRIQLQPIELGSIELRLRTVAGEMKVEIKVENDRTYRTLVSDQNAITSALQGLGTRVDNVSVQMMDSGGSSAEGRPASTERNQHENMDRKHGHNASGNTGRRSQQSAAEADVDLGSDSSGTYI